jgi:hypothetical protein
MSQQSSLTQRLEILENEVARLKQRLDQIAPEKNWIDQISGSMKDNPAFPEAMRLGAAFRQADRPAEDESQEP